MSTTNDGCRQDLSELGEFTSRPDSAVPNRSPTRLRARLARAALVLVMAAAAVPAHATEAEEPALPAPEDVFDVSNEPAELPLFDLVRIAFNNQDPIGATFGYTETPLLYEPEVQTPLSAQVEMLLDTSDDGYGANEFGSDMAERISGIFNGSIRAVDVVYDKTGVSAFFSGLLSGIGVDFRGSVEPYDFNGGNYRYPDGDYLQSVLDAWEEGTWEPGEVVPGNTEIPPEVLVGMPANFTSVVEMHAHFVAYHPVLEGVSNDYWLSAHELIEGAKAESVTMLEYAIRHYNSRRGSDWGGAATVEDYVRFAYAAGIRGQALRDLSAVCVAETAKESLPRPFVIGDYNYSAEVLGVPKTNEMSPAVCQVHFTLEDYGKTAHRIPAVTFNSVGGFVAARVIYDDGGGSLEPWRVTRDGSHELFYADAERAIAKLEDEGFDTSFVPNLSASILNPGEIFLSPPDAEAA